MSKAYGLSIAALASVAFTAPCLAATWVVDDNGGPGVDFVSIQAAVDAAVDGDVIEVRDGDYAGFTIDGKSLVVVAADGDDVRVTMFVVVRNVPAGGRTELVGLRIGQPRAVVGGGASLQVDDCDGSVRIDACDVQGWYEPYYYGACYADPCAPTCDPNPEVAMHCTASAEVVLLASTLRGGDGYDISFNSSCVEPTGGAPALLAEGSTITILDATLEGGAAGGFFCHGECTPGFAGGEGARLSAGSTLLAHRSTFTGGDGGSGGANALFCVGCQPFGPQGAGVRLLSGSSGEWKDSVFDGGVDGPGAQTPIAPYCLGTYEACPCGNNGAGTAGCEHSFGTGGARLAGVGNASVAADTVTLQITGLNPNASPTALFFQGTTGSEGILFNDGLLCAGGTIRRMKGKLAQNGAVSFGFGQAGDPLVSVAGNVPPAGATRFYQVWYRNNSASFCTPQRFNMSNGVEIAWAP